MSFLELCSLVVGLTSLAVAVWQICGDRARRRRHKAKKLKAELKAAKKRVAELEAHSKPAKQ